VGERVRSHWAWGWDDRLPSVKARRALGQQLSFVLGIEPPTPRDAVPLSEARCPEPRLAPPAALSDWCTDDRESRIRHTYGRSYRDIVRGFQGDFSGAPDLVARPPGEAEVSALLAWAEEVGAAVVPYGGGTSVVGGVECAPDDRYAGVICLDTRGMDQVLEVDTVSRAANIQAGATGPALEAQLAEHGLTLRHFPQSFEFSTLGGWIVTRAGGHFATLYTHIDDLVESVRMVTPTGIWDSRRLPASGAGPAPDRLVLGSEGILGVVTSAWVRLQERPRWRSKASVHFADYEAGVGATRRIAQAGLYPTNCRLLDGNEALLNQVAAGIGAVLLLGFESADSPRRAWLERALAIALEAGGVCPEPPEHSGPGENVQGADAAGRWRRAFLDGPYLQSALVSLGVVVDTFETAVTWSRFPELHASITKAVQGAMKEHCGGGFLSCRFTHVYPDGPAPYYTFIAPGGADPLRRWEAIKRAASDALAAGGATITHHHAVGRLHRPWYDAEAPEPFRRSLSASKGALDPSWILNPGVLIDRD